MYDYVKIETVDKELAIGLIQNNLLNFECSVNIKTGEINNLVQIAEYKNLTFSIYPSNRITITGSLHKYWNDGQHNYNDFNIYAIRDTINDIAQRFNIDPNLARISHLEVGMNIITPFMPNDLLRSLIVFKTTPFNRMRVIGLGRGRDVYFQQFGVKMYNKGDQHNRPYNILRFEKKYLRMKNLGWGKVLLSDLMRLDFAEHCINELLKCFDEIIMTEKIDTKQLNKVEKRIFDCCNNPLNWENMTRKQRCNYKSKFIEIIQLHGKQKYKQTINELLKNKAVELTKCTEKAGTF